MMFHVDREASVSVRDQLVEQLRYHIARGRFSLDETLPSTRKLAEQVDVSFHTVRKAYQALESEGLVDARPGSGYVVIAQSTLSKSERMERGAAIIQDAVQRLIGLGLTGPEMEYLYEEQLALLNYDRQVYKILVLANFQELAHECAEQLSATLQQEVQAVTMDELGRHADADFLFAAYPLLKQAQAELPRADVVGYSARLEGEVLDLVARLLDNKTLGLLVRRADSISHMSNWLKRETGFGGNIMAATTEQSKGQLRAFMASVDHVVYTAGAGGIARRFIGNDQRHGQLDFLLSEAVMNQARSVVPG